VSHDLETVASLCDRAVYLERGEVRSEGPAIAIVDSYREDVASTQGGEVGRWEGGAVYGNGAVTLHDIRLEVADDDGSIATGDRIAVCFDAEAHETVDDTVFGLILRANDGTYLYDTNTLWRRMATGHLRAGDRRAVRFELVANLLPGRYTVTVAASRHDGKVVHDWHTDALGFDVTGPFVANGVVELDGEILVEGVAPATSHAGGSPGATGG
jgi:hypothetical protein